MQIFSFMKMHLKISSVIWQPFCPAGDQLIQQTSVEYIPCFLPLQPKPIEVQVISHHMQRYAVWFGGSMLASTVSSCQDKNFDIIVCYATAIMVMPDLLHDFFSFFFRKKYSFHFFLEKNIVFTEWLWDTFFVIIASENGLIPTLPKPMMTDSHSSSPSTATNKHALHVNGSVQDCGISIADTLEIPQSCSEPLICPYTQASMLTHTWFD